MQHGIRHECVQCCHVMSHRVRHEHVQCCHVTYVTQDCRDSARLTWTHTLSHTHTFTAILTPKEPMGVGDAPLRDMVSPSLSTSQVTGTGRPACFSRLPCLQPRRGAPGPAKWSVTCSSTYRKGHPARPPAPGATAGRTGVGALFSFKKNSAMWSFFMALEVG